MCSQEVSKYRTRKERPIGIAAIVETSSSSEESRLKEQLKIKNKKHKKKPFPSRADVKTYSHPKHAGNRRGYAELMKKINW